MRRRLLWLCFCFLLIIPNTLLAQEDWWGFALNRTTGQLIAFTIDGKSQVLLDAVDGPFGDSQWRLDGQTALAVMIVNDEPGMYKLTPQGAVPVTAQFDEPLSTLLGGLFMPVAYSGDYAVFLHTRNDRSTTGLLVNLETATAEQLTGHFGTNQEAYYLCCRFSEDGSVLRYVSAASLDTAEWTLRERQLGTGEESSLHTLKYNQTGRTPRILADVDGNHWLYITSGDDPDHYNLVTADGSFESLGNLDQRQFLGDDLLIYYSNCVTNCTEPARLERYPAGGGDVITYSVPEAGAYLMPLASTEDGDVIVSTVTTISQLHPDGTSSLIGQYSGSGLQVTYPPLIVSPDGRYIAALDNAAAPTHYAVWDTTSEQVIVEGSIERSAGILYGESGFLSGTPAGGLVFYRYADQTAFEPPGATDTEFRLYQAILPDGALLYQLFDADGTQGIFRYDPSSEADTVVLEGDWELIANESLQSSLHD